MQKQDLSKLQLRKVKALKRKNDTKPEDESANGNEEKSGSKKKKQKVASEDYE